jgi:hypothetical protein
VPAVEALRADQRQPVYGQSFNKQTELSADGKTWVPFSASKYLKVKAAK